MEIDESRQRERWNATLALPEDADSIQMGLGEVIRLMMTRQVDHRTAALTLYALQTASANLKHTSFEPPPMTVVIDRECAGQRPIGATACLPSRNASTRSWALTAAPKIHGSRSKKEKTANSTSVSKEGSPGWRPPRQMSACYRTNRKETGTLGSRNKGASKSTLPVSNFKLDLESGI